MDIQTPVGVLGKQLARLGRFVLGKTPPAGSAPCPYIPFHLKDSGYALAAGLAIGTYQYITRPAVVYGTEPAVLPSINSLVALTTSVDQLSSY